MWETDLRFAPGLPSGWQIERERDLGSDVVAHALVDLEGFPSLVRKLTFRRLSTNSTT